VEIASGKGLFGDYDKTRTGIQERNKERNIFNDIASQSGFAENTARNRPVATLGREYQRSLGKVHLHWAAGFSNVG
jgi:hypothetical protein